MVEPKDDIVKRMGHSPNKADAAVIGNWVRPRAKVVEAKVLEEHHHPGFDWIGKNLVRRKKEGETAPESGFYVPRYADDRTLDKEAA